MENGNKNYHEIVLNYWLSDLFLKIFWMKSEKKENFIANCFLELYRKNTIKVWESFCTK